MAEPIEHGARIRIYAERPLDETYRLRRIAYDACIAAGLTPPPGASPRDMRAEDDLKAHGWDLSEGCGLRTGVANIELADSEVDDTHMCVVADYPASANRTWNIDLAGLPAGTTSIRVEVR